MKLFRAALVLAGMVLAPGVFAQVVKESEVPSNVRATALQQNKNEAVSSWVLDKKRGKYVATTISTTAMRGIEVSLDGKWIQTTEAVLPQNMPAAVMSSARKAYTDYELDNFFYVTEPDKRPYYSIDASSDEEDLTLTIDPSGKILEKKSR